MAQQIQALPGRPSLEFLRKLAKKRRRASVPSGASMTLAAAQLAIARDYGFVSWRALRAHVTKLSTFAAQAKPTDQQIAEFIDAIKRDDRAAVQSMLRALPALANAASPSGGTVLHVAVERDDPPLLRLLLDAGADPAARFGQHGHTALSWSITVGAFKAAQALVRRGEKPDLFCAAGLGDLRAVKSFFNADDHLKEDVSQTGSSRFTSGGARLPSPPVTQCEVVSDALYMASRHGRADVVRFLLRHDPDLAFRAYMGGMPLHWAHFSGSAAVIRMLEKAGADSTARDYTFKLTPREFGICVPANWGFVALVRRCLTRDRSLALVCTPRGTPLHEAVRAGSMDVARLLLAAGTDRSTVNDEGHTAAEIAQERGHTDLAAFLALSSASPIDDFPAKIDAFLTSALSHHTDERPNALRNAEALGAEEPRIAAASLLTACVMGDARSAAAFIARDPNSARINAGPKNWPPILYLAFSRYLKFRPKLEPQFVRIAKLLLANGADPNSHFIHEGFNETALYGAAGIANRPKLTRLLLDSGADPNDLSEKSGNESLYHATEHLDNACLKLLLKKKPRRDAISYCLARKLDFEDAAGAKLMLDHGADPNFIMPAGSNCVLHAIRRGRSVAILKLLHSYGAKLDIPDNTGMTPLKLARRLGQKEAVQFLVKQGVEEPADAREQFLATCAAGRRGPAMKLLKQDPTVISRLSEDQIRVLPDAAASNHLWPVRHMLDLGFDINTKGDWGGAAIHHAVWNGHVAMARFLIHRGADLHQKNNYGGDALGTALHAAQYGPARNSPQIVALVAKAMNDTDLSPYLKAAVKSGDETLVKAIRSAIAKPPKPPRTSKNWKPIMDAAFHGDAAAVRRLIKAGADPNVVSTTAHRYRPLHRAIEFKKLTPRGPEHEEVVKALLEAGADPTQPGGFAKLTVLQLAATDGPRFVPLLRRYFEPLNIFNAAAVADDECVAALLQFDRKLASARDEKDWTPLHYACASAMHKVSKEHADALLRVVKLLLKAGADPSAAYKFEGDWPLTALYHATGHQNNAAVAELLLKAGASPYDGESVYHSADEGHVESLALLEKYSDPKKLAAECTNALGALLHWGRSRGAPWLLAHGADPNELHRRYGDSALHSAVKNKSSDDVICLLLRHGARPKLKNKEGKSAIDLARPTPRLARLLAGG